MPIGRSIKTAKTYATSNTSFVESGLADPKFVSELVSGEEHKFWSCLSEALIAQRLSDKKFLARSSRERFPEFFERSVAYTKNRCLRLGTCTHALVAFAPRDIYDQVAGIRNLVVPSRARDKICSSTDSIEVFSDPAWNFGLARPKPGVGPDFLVMNGERKIWIEVVCPEPVQLPDKWLNFQPNTVVSFPHEEILLRWTSAIKVKAEQLIGNENRPRGYLASGIVAKEDAYVIAVNSAWSETIKHSSDQAVIICPQDRSCRAGHFDRAGARLPTC